MNTSIKKEDMGAYFFHQGTNYFAYDYLGCHENVLNNGEFEYTFRVWAPNADEISVVSDITSWDNGAKMHKISGKGVWEYKFNSPSSLIGSFYKYKITRNGVVHYKADPYAFHSQSLEKTASIIANIDGFSWNDEAWLNYRKQLFLKSENSKDSSKYYYQAPMNIYEVHLASWKTRNSKSTNNGENYLNYKEIADELAPYVKKMGYTHIELMPVMEYPYDGSWGYQVCGYYSPSSRYGSPKDFMYFVNKMHENGIGVILDWVPAHFPKDEHGLYEFDGAPLYEYQGKDRMEHRVWGTRFFDLGREEVQSFLISNALFWMRKYHVDGLRVDAVASMLYLDYDRDPGEWIPNEDGSNRNKEAIAFFQKLNTLIFGEFNDVLMIAEESADWPNITKTVDRGGLGFNYKWNMGWANDMFDYVETDPLFRKGKHDKLTFPMMYAFNENYIYPISHDEVVHGKKSLIDKMYGDYNSKFSQMRSFMTYMMTMPGKKMTFMGTEYAQFREWDYENELEWFMLKYPRHAEMQRFIAHLNNFYLENKELWEIDNSWDGYKWIDANQSDINVISYKRIAIDGSELIIVVNFSPVTREGYRINVEKSGKYQEVLSTDEYRFGGNNILNDKPIKSAKYQNESQEKQNYIEIRLPSYGAVILRRIDGRAKKG